MTCSITACATPIPAPEVCTAKTRKEDDIQLPAADDSCEHYIISVAPLTTIVSTTAIISQFKNITGRKYSDVADHITMSLGGAMMIPTHDNSPADLIALADQALYRAKNNGRNTLYLATS